MMSGTKTLLTPLKLLPLIREGVYPSLIGTLVIVMHEHKAELQLISQAHGWLGRYSSVSIIICRSLYQELKREEASPSVVSCAPSVVDKMQN
jgi:hypothetical protein